VALLGGTFAPLGGHNVLEPLRAGLPTVHGPSTSNLGATLRQATGATFGVADAGAAAERIEELLRNPQRRLLASAAAGRIFDANQGAARRAAEAALALLRSVP
jgi:3-deoxy-D-manno-octulosonic-acid transferase